MDGDLDRMDREALITEARSTCAFHLNMAHLGFPINANDFRELRQGYTVILRIVFVPVAK